MTSNLLYLNARLPTIEDFKRQETNLVKVVLCLLGLLMCSADSADVIAVS